MNKIQPFLTLKIIFCVSLITFFLSEQTFAQSYNINNDSFLDTKNGKPIYSQGGGIFKFPDPETGEEKYYWYGVHYKGAETYREDPSATQRGIGFAGISCYSSTDLVNCEFEAHVLTPDEVFKDGRKYGWLGRMGVAYVKEASQYVLVIQYNSRVLFAISNSHLGPFKYQHEKSMMDWIGTSNTGDQTVLNENIIITKIIVSNF